MKILILNSSPRKNGVTTAILNAIAKGISSTHTITWIDVNDLAVKPCLGCLRCRPDKTCILSPDDGHRVRELINQADFLIIGSPTYWGNITGPLKLLFDRNVPVFEYIGQGLPQPRQKGKRAIIVVSSAAPFPFNLLSTQSRGTIRAIKSVLHGGGYKVQKIINIASSMRFNPSTDPRMESYERLGRLVY